MKFLKKKIELFPRLLFSSFKGHYSLQCFFYDNFFLIFFTCKGDQTKGKKKKEKKIYTLDCRST